MQKEFQPPDGPAGQFLILHFELVLAAGDGGDDTDLVAVFERRLAVLEEADVLLVDIDVDEAAHLAFFIHEAFLDAGEARLQFDDRLADGGGVDFDQLLVVGQLAEWRGDSDFLWHKLNFKFAKFFASSKYSKTH
jgi:hypothetical protein